MSQDLIKVRGAREHNLKNVSIDIPKNKLVVFTGISGSGKSSLAFDTIYAEGQRRYVESLSSYARQFLGVMDKPDIDSIEGLSPAISIDQKSVSHNPRSTVGTVTEIYDYLRLFFARVGHPHCPNCGREIAQQSAQQIVDRILEWSREQLAAPSLKSLRFLVLSPIIRDRKGEFIELLKTLRTRGYTKVRIDGRIYDLSDDIILIKTNKHTIEAVIDRLVLDLKLLKDEVGFSTVRTRLSEAVDQGLALSEGYLVIAQVMDKGFTMPDSPTDMQDHLYSEKFACPICNISIPEVEPRTFSFNSPHGACPTCTGLGTLRKVDPELVLNPRLTINEGAILPFSSMFIHDTWYARLIKTVCEENDIPTQKPLGLLSQEQKNIILYGTGDRMYRVDGRNRQGRMTTIHETYAGVVPEVERRHGESDSTFVREEIEKFMREEVCSECKGSRLKKESLAVTIDGKPIVDVTNLSTQKALDWLNRLIPSKTVLNESAMSSTQTNSILSPRELMIATPIIKELKARLGFLVSVGLDYLTLDRTATTLAGGEGQRIRLASQIGSGLSGVLYVLDEPSIGLHQRDNDRLIHTLKTLRDIGNSVLVVEHDQDLMEESDYIFDFGPKAGEHGGTVIAQGTPEDLKKDSKSITGAYLSGRKKIAPREKKGTEDSPILSLKDCSQFNLKGVNLNIPLGKFVCVTGVSGSGKSTLVVDTLYHALARHMNPFHKEKPGKYSDMVGVEAIDKVILIDQSPIGRTPRSNPATYTGAFNYIRQLYAYTQEARTRGYKLGRFSFNVKGGRCEVCQGEGQLKIEMQFLPDVYVDCEVCGGTRYNRDTLEVHYRGKNIAQVLSMTVEEAYQFFININGLSEKLKTLNEVGLSYIKLGQPAPTLSGGEAQRIKLAAELSKRATGKTIYILDEPTTGLHFADLEKLIGVLDALVRRGNTVVVIEHNLDVIKNADWIIDLGPEGGEGGGKILVEGTPQQIANFDGSYTGEYLKRMLNNSNTA